MLSPKRADSLVLAGDEAQSELNPLSHSNMTSLQKVYPEPDGEKWKTPKLSVIDKYSRNENTVSPMILRME
jgi:hypothetical protein